MSRRNGKRQSRRFLTFLAGLAAGGIPSCFNRSVADVTSTWNLPGSGNWSVAGNWSPSANDPNNGTPAGTNYQAVINSPGTSAYTVTVNSNISVDGVSINSSNATLTDTAGILTVGSLNVTSGLFQLAGGTLSGGTAGALVTLTSPSQFTFTRGTLNNLTFAGSNLNFSQSGTIQITNGLNLSGNALNLTSSSSNLFFICPSQANPNQTIDDLGVDATGQNQSTFAIGGATLTAAATLSLGPNADVHGNFSIKNVNDAADALINNGILSADISSGTLTVGVTNFTNAGLAEAINGGTLLINATNWTNGSSGTISANASTIALGGSWSNAGTISAINESTVTLGGTFTYADIASFNASADSTVTLNGTLNNLGNTLTLSNIAAPWTLSGGGTIANGAVATGSNLNIVNGTLSGVTIPSGGTVQVPSGGTLSLTGVWNNLGTVSLGAGATLNLVGVTTVEELGSINGQGNNTVNFKGNTSGILTLTPSMGTVNLNNAVISNATINVTGNQTLNIGPVALLDDVTLQGFSPNTAALTDLQIENGLTGTGQNLYITGVGAPSIEFLSPNTQLTDLYIVKANTSGPLVNAIFAGNSYNNAPAATLTIASNAGITATAGKIYLEAADLTNSTIVNNGTVSANGPTGIIDMTFLPVFTNDGTLSASNGGTIFVDNASLVNNGLIQSNAGTLSLHVTNNSGGTIDATNQSQLILSPTATYGYLTNYGNIIVDNSTGAINGGNTAGNFTNSGTIDAINGAAVSAYFNFTNAAGATIDDASSFTLAGTWENDGTIIVESSGTLLIPSGSRNAGASASVLNNGAIVQSAGQASIGGVSGAGTLTIGNNIGGSSAFMSVASLIQSNVTVNPTGSLQITGGTANAVNSLTVSTTGYASLDLTTSMLAINYGTGSDPNATIRAELISGYNKGAWNGLGIDSSSIGPGGTYAIGYADGNLDPGTVAGTNQLIIRYTFAGDANLDGIVNFPDLLVVAQNYGRSGEDWAHGDFNYDGIVNFPDLLAVAQNYGKQLSAGQLAELPGSFAAQWQLAETEIQAAGSSSVPEPASIGLLIAGCALMMRRPRLSPPGIRLQKPILKSLA